MSRLTFVGTITKISDPLCLCLQGLEISSAGLFIELPGHEVLVGVQVLIQVDNLLKRHLVGAPPHRFLCEVADFLFFAGVLHVV